MSLNQNPLGVKNTLNVTTALSYDNGTTFLRKAGTDYSRKVFFFLLSTSDMMIKLFPLSRLKLPRT